jgi:hypothetical protein
MDIKAANKILKAEPHAARTGIPRAQARCAPSASRLYDE